MKKNSGYLAVAVAMTATALLALVPAGPASAAAGDTTTTFALTGGSVSIAVQATAALTNAPSGSASVTGQLGTVLVTDQRGGVVAWNASGTSTVFTGSTGSTSTSVVYNAGAFTTTGNITMAPAVPVTLTTTPAVVATANTVHGNATASWNPTLVVNLPPDALAGNYTGTVHSSVA